MCVMLPLKKPECSCFKIMIGLLLPEVKGGLLGRKEQAVLCGAQN